MSDEPTEIVLTEAECAALDDLWKRTSYRSEWHATVGRIVAERIAQVRREGAAEVTARVEALADEWAHVGGGDSMGSVYAEGYHAAMRAQAETLRATLRGDA